MRVYNGVMGFIRGLTGSSVAVDDNQHQAPPGNYIAIDMSALQPVADLAADRQGSADFLAPSLPCGRAVSSVVPAVSSVQSVVIPRLTLHLDLHRAGYPNVPVEGEQLWSAKTGAVVLFNNDKEQPSQVKGDHEDNLITGEAEAADPDIVGIRIVKEPADGVFPPGWSFVLELREPSRAHFFINYLVGERACIGPKRQKPLEVSLAPCPAITFSGLEALGYACTLDERMLDIGFAVLDANDETQSQVTAQLRIAPWIMCHHLMPLRQVYVISKNLPERPPIPGDDGLVEDQVTRNYVADLTRALGGRVRPLLVETNDNWVRDMFYNGYSVAPGRPPLMQVLECPSARGRYGLERIKAAMKGAHLGPGRGYAVPIQPREVVTDLDSGGNFLCTPPLPGYPFGRIVHGNDASRPVSKDLLDFIHAQGMQAPLAIDTSWLKVGHIDEVLTFIPWPQGKAKNQSRHGFRVLVASHRKAMELVRIAPGGRLLFRQHLGEGEGFIRDKALKGLADFTCGSVCACALLEGVTNEVEGYIDHIIVTLLAALDLGDHDVVKLPVLFHLYGTTPAQVEALENAAKPSILELASSESKKQEAPVTARQRFVAYTPNVVNMLVATSRLGQATLCVPKPNGPSGEVAEAKYHCSFEAYIAMVLSESGNDIVFIDDFAVAHRNAGEIHCTTFEVRDVADVSPWWDYAEGDNPKKPREPVPVDEKSPAPASRAAPTWQASSKTLDVNQYLDDAIMERYYAVLRVRYAASRFFFIDPSVSYMMAMGSEFDAVVAMADMTQGGDPDVVFFPVNNNRARGSQGGTHWTLIVYVRAAHRFHYYDSLNNPPDEAALAAHARLKALFQDQAPLTQQNAPLQKESECGAYVLALSDAFAAYSVDGNTEKWNRVFAMNSIQVRAIIRQAVAPAGPA